MSEPFQIKAGDRLPSLQGTIADGSGTALDLTGATVVFRMTKLVEDPATGAMVPGQTPLFSKAAVIVDAPTGVVRYDWAAGDTDDYGDFAAEFKVTIGGKPWTTPTVGYIPVSVLDSL